MIVGENFRQPMEIGAYYVDSCGCLVYTFGVDDNFSFCHQQESKYKLDELTCVVGIRIKIDLERTLIQQLSYATVEKNTLIPIWMFAAKMQWVKVDPPECVKMRFQDSMKSVKRSYKVHKQIVEYFETTQTEEE